MSISWDEGVLLDRRLLEATHRFAETRTLYGKALVPETPGRFPAGRPAALLCDAKLTLVQSKIKCVWAEPSARAWVLPETTDPSWARRATRARTLAQGKRAGSCSVANVRLCRVAAA